MPNPKIIYITGYNVAKNSGRNKATREKAAALAELAGPDRFIFLFPGTSDWRFLAYARAFLFDFRVLLILLFVEKNSRIIQRTTFLPFTNIYLKLRGIKIIYELHTDFKDEIKHYHVNSVEKAVLYAYAYIEQFNLWIADAIIYNHPVLQQLTQKRFPRPSIYTYNGANIKDFVPLDMQECRKLLGLPGNTTCYLFAGSLARWRGVDLLIDIFRKYMSGNEVLFIVGNAGHPYGNELKQMASGNSNVIFKDEVPANEIVKWINAADVCLVPVKPVLSSPGNPLKLYDYIACGKPVAGQANVTGCSDEIIKYHAGVTIDFFNAAQAASELRAFATQADAAFYHSHNREIAVHHISWEKRMTEWLKFIEATFSGNIL